MITHSVLIKVCEDLDLPLYLGEIVVEVRYGDKETDTYKFINEVVSKVPNMPNTLTNFLMYMSSVAEEPDELKEFMKIYELSKLSIKLN